MNDNIKYKMFMGVILFMGFVTIYNSYLRFYPFKTLVVNSVVLETPIVNQGDVLKYKVDYCRFIDTVSTSYKIIVGVSNPELRFPLPVTEGASIKGCHVTERTLALDSEIPPGTYYLKTTAVYKVNDVQTSQVTFDTPVFEIK